jgi:hypothetical protein
MPVTGPWINPRLWTTRVKSDVTQELSCCRVGLRRYVAVMSSVAFKEAAVFDALTELADRPAELLSTSEHQQWLELVERLGRILPALGHDHINELAGAPLGELGGSLRVVLADGLLIRPVRPPGASPRPPIWGRASPAHTRPLDKQPANADSARRRCFGGASQTSGNERKP